MALVHADRCKETSTTTGTGTYTLAGAVTDFQSFAAIGDGNTCYYTAFEAGAGWEVGIGTYTAAGTTLARTTILASTNAGAAVSWAAGTREIFVSLPASRVLGSYVGFPAGTKMLFVQTAAPTGWTKDTDQNDKALRIVSGTPSTGGTVAFSTVFGKTATDAFTLTTAEMPAHTHGRNVAAAGASGSGAQELNTAVGTASGDTDSTGGGGSHTHAMDIRVQYVDVIKATKD